MLVGKIVPLPGSPLKFSRTLENQGGPKPPPPRPRAALGEGIGLQITGPGMTDQAGKV